MRIIEATEITMLRKASEASLAEQAAMLELNQLRGQPWQRSDEDCSRWISRSPPRRSRTRCWRRRGRTISRCGCGRWNWNSRASRYRWRRRTRYPSFTVGPYFSQERAGDREQQVGIGLSMPLPLWNRNEGNIETAMARQQQAETSMYVTQRTVERQVVEKALTYQTKLTEMAKWRPESVEEFRKAAELADRHYRLGAVPIATYVELQKQYLEAVEALLDTKREALEAGQQLELLTGLDINAVRAARKQGASGNLRNR